MYGYMTRDINMFIVTAVSADLEKERYWSSSHDVGRRVVVGTAPSFVILRFFMRYNFSLFRWCLNAPEESKYLERRGATLSFCQNGEM